MELREAEALRDKTEYNSFYWDLENKTVRLPLEKIERIKDLLQAWLIPRAKFFQSKVVSMHSKLVCCKNSYSYSVCC